MSAERKRGLLFGAVIAAAALYGVGLLTLRDVPEPFVEWDIPTDPKEKAAYDLAHSIQLPDSVPKPQPFKFCKTEFLGLCFQKASGREYFEHLCRTEAGEYIFKMVEGVEGLYQMRQRKEATSEELHSLYRMEDPYGYIRGETNPIPFMFVNSYRYRYFEQDAPGAMVPKIQDGKVDPYDPRFFDMPNDKQTIARYTGYSGKISSMKKNYVQDRLSKYGFTWRGIRRSRDREFGVAGGELVVIDTQTNKVLAVRRGFAMTRQSESERGANWEVTPVCPTYEIHTRNKDHDFSYWFIRKVLIPVDANPYTRPYVAKGIF